MLHRLHPWVAGMGLGGSMRASMIGEMGASKPCVPTVSCAAR